MTARGTAEKEPVVIATTLGARIIEGEKYGAWAVTPTQSRGEEKRGEWTVTHVPSGRAVAAKIKLAEARKIAKRAAKRLVLAWQTYQPGAPAPSDVGTLKAILREVLGEERANAEIAKRTTDGADDA